MPDLAALTWTAVFIGVVLAGAALKLWLARRQIRHVSAHRDQLPAVFAGAIPPEAHRKAADYTVARTRFGLRNTLFATIVVLWWTLDGGLQSLNQLCVGAFGRGLGSQLALLLGFSLVGSLLELPWELWQTFALEQRFGFNRSTPRLFAIDWVKNQLLAIALLLPLSALVLWLMQSSRLWWWWGWIAFSAFSLAMMVVFPLWIAPLFNRFQPLPDGEVKTRALALSARCGFALQGLYMMDGSRRSAHANAYFTGIGRARRVVLFDTLLKQLDPTQIEAVLAHEIGHYQLRHIQQRLALTLGLSLVGFALLGWLADQPWFYLGLGVVPHPSGGNAALALILFTLALPAFAVFISPLSAAWSRRHEFQADAYAAAHSDGAALASALLKLTEDNAATLTPDPLYQRVYYSHPPTLERLRALGALPSA